MRSAAPVTQNHLRKAGDLMLQHATPLRKSPPWSPNTSNSCVSCIAPATRNSSVQILFKCPTPAIVFETSIKTLTFCSLLTRCKILLPTTQNDIWTSKSAPYPSFFFALLTLKCASRQSGVHFFDITTSKSAPKLRCFVHFDFEMCLVPQPRAIFHLSSGHGSAPAALASLLFDPKEPQIIGKTQCFATFLPFRAPASSFFWLSLLWSSFFFSSLTLSISAFHLSILSEVWLLNFLRWRFIVIFPCWVVKSPNPPIISASHRGCRVPDALRCKGILESPATCWESATNGAAHPCFHG